MSQMLERVARGVRPLVPFPLRRVLRGIQQKYHLGKFRPELSGVVYVQTVVGLCGGVRVILEHVSRLRARGVPATVWCVCGDASWFPRNVPLVRWGSEERLRQALGHFRGAKVATWYETAEMVAQSLRPGDRGYYLVQDIEESYCETPEQLAAVRRSYTLGLQTISEGVWVENQLRERFGLSPRQVHIGLDLETFQPRGGQRNAQQIMTQARTWSGGVGAGNRIKGWDVARAAILRARELNPTTALMTFSLEQKPVFPSGMKHEHHQYPTDVELSGLYSRAGMYLLTSRHEGFGLTAAEAMACGCPVVTTRADGNEEFCIDGKTALVADSEDSECLAQHCVRLQRDRDLAAALGAAGREFIQQYSWERVIDRLEAEFCQSPESFELPAGPPLPTIDDIPISAIEYPNLNLADQASCEWTVVIPTVGSVDKVVECISTCRRFAPGANIEFVVVDDGCPDPATCEVLREAASELKFELRCHYQNLGFSAAVNTGLRGMRGQFALVCNNDLQFDRPWCNPVGQAFASNSKIGLVSARLLYPDGQKIQHAGTDKVPGQLIFVHAHHQEPADTPAALEDRDVWYATGALMAIRRETLRDLGGLSTGFALAYEDLDYALYAWMRGWRVRYCGRFVARHQEGGTRGGSERAKRERPLIWLQREDSGRAYFLRKWEALRHIESPATMHL